MENILFEKIVNKVIREDCRKEAIQIINLSSEHDKNELIRYYDEIQHCLLAS